MAENFKTQIDDVRGSGVYPASELQTRNMPVRTAGEWGHPEMRRRMQVSPGAVETAAHLAGRAIFGGYFVYNGLQHFKNRKMLVDYARAKGVPAPAVAVVGSGLLILTGGLSLMAGAWPKAGAGLIATFLLGVSPQMHAFWKESDPQQRMSEMVNFTKNMALVGGSLLAAAHPEPWSWRLAVDRGAMLPATTRP